MQFNNSCILQLFGCPSTWSAPARAFYGSKPSLLLAERCVLGCWAVGCSRACDVWGGGCVGGEVRRQLLKRRYFFWELARMDILTIQGHHVHALTVDRRESRFAISRRNNAQAFLPLPDGT